MKDGGNREIREIRETRILFVHFAVISVFLGEIWVVMDSLME